MSKQIKKADLFKIANQFVVVYSTNPTIVIPMLIGANLDKHRTDVPIEPALLFCKIKPIGDLTLRLLDCKAMTVSVDQRIGKVGKAVMQKIEIALQKERAIRTIEQLNVRVNSQMKKWV